MSIPVFIDGASEASGSVAEFVERMLPMLTLRKIAEAPGVAISVNAGGCSRLFVAHS